jgi:hypothetical protein
VRINDPPPINVNRPDARGPLRGVAPTQAVTPQSSLPQVPQPAAAERVEAAPPLPPVERRRNARRAGERRKQQLSVTLNTRVGQRRLSRRRAADSAASTAIDIEA